MEHVVSCAVLIGQESGWREDCFVRIMKKRGESSLYEVKDKKNATRALSPSHWKTSERRWDVRGNITVSFGILSSMQRKIKDLPSVKIILDVSEKCAASSLIVCQSKNSIRF